MKKIEKPLTLAELVALEDCGMCGDRDERIRLITQIRERKGGKYEEVSAYSCGTNR